ncbi:2-oxoisovalerate dehydrogenase [candidate division WOR-3 bacterium]|nr:2-oxoisovalerate dehydrogenase [candidate division WOR-3 bacterium]
MPAVEFTVEEQEGAFVARSSCGCIVTEGRDLEELYRNVREAARCHGEECEPPTSIVLRFIRVIREETLAP